MSEDATSSSNYGASCFKVLRGYSGECYNGSGSTHSSIDKVHQDDIVKFVVNMEARTAQIFVNDKDCGVIFNDLPAEVFPVAVFYGAGKKIGFDDGSSKPKTASASPAAAVDMAPFEENLAFALSQIASDNLYRRALVDVAGGKSSRTGLGTIAFLLRSDSVASQQHAVTALLRLTEVREFHRNIVLTCLTDLVGSVVCHTKDMRLANRGVGVLDRIAAQPANLSLLLKSARVTLLKRCIEDSHFDVVTLNSTRVLLMLLEQEQSEQVAVRERVVIALGKVIHFKPRDAPAPAADDAAKPGEATSGVAVIDFNDRLRVLRVMARLARIEGCHEDIVAIVPQLDELVRQVLEEGEAGTSGKGQAGPPPGTEKPAPAGAAPKQAADAEKQAQEKATLQTLLEVVEVFLAFFLHATDAKHIEGALSPFMLNFVDKILQSPWTRGMPDFMEALLQRLIEGFGRIVARSEALAPTAFAFIIPQFVAIANEGKFQYEQNDMPTKSYMGFFLGILSVFMTRARTVTLRHEQQILVFKSLFREAETESGGGQQGGGQGAPAAGGGGQGAPVAAAEAPASDHADAPGAAEALLTRSGGDGIDGPVPEPLPPADGPAVPKERKTAPTELFASTAGPEFVQLLADLCADRGLDEDARLAIRSLIPFASAVAKFADPGVAMPTRAAYLDFLLKCYVDCFPRAPIDTIEFSVRCVRRCCVCLLISVRASQRPVLGSSDMVVAKEPQLEGLLKLLRRIMLRELRIGTENPFWMRAAEASVEAATAQGLALQRTLALRCLSVFKMLVTFGCLPDRASVLEYFRRFEIEVMGLIDSRLLTAVSKGADKSGRFDKVVVVDDTKEWNKHARVVFEIIHLLHKNNMNALVSDVLRFYGRRRADIDLSLRVIDRRSIFDMALSTVKNVGASTVSTVLHVGASTVKNVGAISIHGSKRVCLCVPKRNAVAPLPKGLPEVGAPVGRKSATNGVPTPVPPALVKAGTASRMMQSALDMDSREKVITVDDWLDDLKTELLPVLASASLTSESSARLLQTTGMTDRTLVSCVLQVIMDQHDEFNHLASCLRKLKLVASGSAIGTVRVRAWWLFAEPALVVRVGQEWWCPGDGNVCPRRVARECRRRVEGWGRARHGGQRKGCKGLHRHLRGLFYGARSRENGGPVPTVCK